MDEALELLDEIRDHVTTCCAITMDPNDVEELIDKLMNILIEIKE